MSWAAPSGPPGGAITDQWRPFPVPPMPTVPLPPGLWAVVLLLAGAGLFLGVPTLTAIPDVLSFLSEGGLGGTFALLILIFLLELLLLAAGLIALAVLLSRGDYVARAISVVVAACMGVGLLLDGLEETSTVITVLACGGVAGILTASPSVSAFFLARLPDGRVRVPVLVAQVLAMLLAACLAAVGVAFLPVMSVDGKFLLVGGALLGISYATFRTSRRLVLGDPRVRQQMSLLMAGYAVAIFLGQDGSLSGPLFVWLAMAGAVVALLWVPGPSRAHFGDASPARPSPLVDSLFGNGEAGASPRSTPRPPPPPGYGSPVPPSPPGHGSPPASERFLPPSVPPPPVPAPPVPAPPVPAPPVPPPPPPARRMPTHAQPTTMLHGPTPVPPPAPMSFPPFPAFPVAAHASALPPPTGTPAPLPPPHLLAPPQPQPQPHNQHQGQPAPSPAASPLLDKAPAASPKPSRRYEVVAPSPAGTPTTIGVAYDRKSWFAVPNPHEEHRGAYLVSLVMLADDLQRTAFRGNSTLLITNDRLAGVCPRGESSRGPLDPERGPIAVWTLPLDSLDWLAVEGQDGAAYLPIKGWDQTRPFAMMAKPRQLSGGAFRPCDLTHLAAAVNEAKRLSW